MSRGFTKLGDLVKISKGKKANNITRELEAGLKRFIQIDDLRNDNNLKYTSDDGVVVQENDIIIAWDGANAGTIGYGLNGIIGSTLAALTLKTDQIDSEYLGRFLQTKSEYLRSKCTGATIPHISKDVLLNLSVPIVPIEEQHRIVKILDQAQSIIEKRKQAIAYLDDYIKAVFLDMFGDPVSNPKDFPLTRLGTLGDWHSGGTPLRNCPDYFSGNIPWYSSGELNDIFISDSNEYISEIAVKESSAKIIPTRCLLLGMYDSAALKSSITTIESSCNQAIAYAKLDENKANTIYVYHCIQYGKNHYKKNQRGVRQKNLNLSMIKALEIPIPKIDDQNEFEMIFNQSFQLKLKMQSQLKELEDNFQAQLQRAFRGE